MFGFGGYLLDNDCYASLAGVLIQIQYGSVSRSRQLLRCMGTRLNFIEGDGGGGGGFGETLQIFVLLCRNGWQ